MQQFATTPLRSQPLDLLSSALRRNLQPANQAPEDVLAIVYSALRRDQHSDAIIEDALNINDTDLPLRVEAYIAQSSERVRWRPPGPVAAIHENTDGHTVIRCNDALMFIDPQDRVQTVRVPRLTASSQSNDVVITGDGEGTVTFWDPALGQVVARFAAHRAAVTHVVVGLNTAYSCAADGSIIQWEQTPWMQGTRFDAPAGICAVAVSSWEDALVVGCRNGDILEITSEGTSVHSRAHAGAVAGIACMASQLIVSAGADRMLRTFKSGKTTAMATVVTGHTIGITGLVAARNDDRVATYGPDRRILVWDISHVDGVPKLAFDLGMHEAAITMAQFGREMVEPRLITGSADGVVMRWDAKGRPVVSHHRHWAAVRAGVFRKDGILTGGDDAQLDRCDLDLTLVPNGGVSECASANDVVVVCNGGSAQLVTSSVTSASIAKTTGTSVALHSDGRRALLWREGATSATEWILGGAERILPPFNGRIVRCAYVGDTPVVALDNGTVIAKDRAVRSHDGPITTMVPATDQAIIGGADGSIVRVAVGDGTHQIVDVLQARVSVLASFGALIAAGTIDGELAVWENRVAILGARHDELVSHLAFGSAPDTLVSVCADSSITIWNYRGGARLATWVGHRDRITALVVDDRSNLIYTASLDRTVRAWDFEGKPRGVVYGDYPFSAMTVIRNAAMPGMVLVGDDAGGLLTLTYRGAVPETEDEPPSTLPKGPPRKKVIKKAPAFRKHASSTKRKHVKK